MAGTLFSELAEIVRLRRGRHRSPNDGVCAMELVAWMAGEKHSDHPRSASPAIAAFIRPFNDALDIEQRQRLGALAVRIIGTRGTREQEAARGQLLWDWMITVAVPTWLDAAGRPDLAASVVRGRGAALATATHYLDVHGHVSVRPHNDRHRAGDVSQALGAGGITGACIAGRDTADGASPSRARRNWEAARVLCRAAAWSVSEQGDELGGAARGALDRTTAALRESALVLVEQLIAVTAPLPPPAPTVVDWATSIVSDREAQLAEQVRAG